MGRSCHHRREPPHDYCDPDQAVAAANKFIAEGVDVVIGHVCSGAAIAASKLYAQAGILMMTNTATNPLLTEQGFAHAGMTSKVSSRAAIWLSTGR